MNKEKILIVDDDSHYINHIIKILENTQDDYIFFQANNGEIAYKITKTKQPDIIITDWQMPVCNGIDFIKKIKSEKNLKNIPILMVTGVNITSKSLKIAFDAGVVDFLRKPIDEIELQARLHSALMLSKSHKQIIESKNQKIEQNTLLLLEKVNIIDKINKKLKILYSNIANKTPIEEFYGDIKIEIKKNSSINIWANFEKTFDEVNLEFRRNVLQKYPNITNSELKLCMLLRINLPTKYIAHILNKSTNSIKVSRFRIRKKFGLDITDNLQSFMSQY